MSVRTNGVAWVELPHVALGVATLDVSGIREAERADGIAYDLDARFGSAPHAGAGPMRIIELFIGRALATRAEVRVELLAEQDELDLPPFVADWAHGRGLARIARRETGFGYLIAPRPFLEGLDREPQGENDVSSG